jgi:hypothetical protein
MAGVQGASRALEELKEAIRNLPNPTLFINTISEIDTTFSLVTCINDTIIVT